MVARLAPVQKVACSNHVRVRQVLIFGHILAISLNNISRYIEDDILSLSSVNKGKGTVESKRICLEILYLLNVGEVYFLKQVSKINSFLCPFVFSLKNSFTPHSISRERLSSDLTQAPSLE